MWCMTQYSHRTFSPTSLHEFSHTPFHENHVCIVSSIREDVKGVAGVALATPFFPDLFYMPSRRLAIRSSGHRPSNYLVIRPSGYLVIRPSGHPTIRSSDHSVIWSSRLLAIWSSDHLVILPSGHPTIRLSGHPDFWPSDHPVIRPSSLLAFCLDASKMSLLGYFWPTLL